MAHRLTLRLQREEITDLPLVGSSRSMRELARQVELVSQGNRTTSLLLGEAGTGKARLAEYIHSRSARAGSPFVAVNCASADPDELDLELFGSDGDVGKATVQGLFDSVDGGTIFIDEVADLAPRLQPKLLRMLVGATRRKGAQEAGDSTRDVRVIAAASKDLVTEVNEGRLQEDLYYKLSIIPVHLPPLRARSREDLTELIARAFALLAIQAPRALPELSPDIMGCLLAYAWPGNIRELQNVLERALLVARGAPVLRPSHLPEELREAYRDTRDGHMPRTLMDVERAHIHRTLRAHQANRTHAARELGISRATLIKKIREYGLVYSAAVRG